MHSFYGCLPGSFYHQIWTNLNVIQDLKLIKCKYLRGFETLQGDKFNVGGTKEELRNEMLRFCSNAKDKEGVNVVIKDLEAFMRAYPSISHFPTVDSSLFSNFETSGQYFEKCFSSPLLKKLATKAFGERSSICTHLLCIAAFVMNDLKFPDGGSINFAGKIAKHYRNLGGEIINKAEVGQILFDGNKAVGVKLKNGDVIKADHVVVSSDLSNAFYKLLPKAYKNEKLDKILMEGDIYPSAIMMNIGLKSGPYFSDSYGFYLLKELSTGISILGKSIQSINIRYLQSGKYTPHGGSVMQVLHYINYESYSDLLKDKRKYFEHKQAIISQVLDQLDKCYPGFKANVEEVDMATPLTFERYTHSMRGSFMSFAQTPFNRDYINVLKRPFEGLSNVYNGSIWRGLYGGIACAAESGKCAVDEIKERDGKAII